MISSALGAWTLANTLSGGRLNGFVKKNVGKFAGKIGKWSSDKLLTQKMKDKLNGLTERGAELAEKAIGADSEVAKNMKNFSKELRGEHTELRSWNDGDSKSSGNTNMQDNIGNDIIPYTKNLGGTNYKRYIPTKRFRLPGSLKPLQSKGFPVFKRVDLNRTSKFHGKK